MTAEEKSKKVATAGYVGSSAGFVFGLGYAFKTKKSFWGYVGYSLLFSLIGGTVASVPAYVMLKEDKKEDPKESLKKVVTEKPVDVATLNTKK